MMHGLPGSGKSWLAAQLAGELAAVHIRSDVERKRMAGLKPLDPSHSELNHGLYAAAQTASVYERLSHCALQVLDGRPSVIVDANFGLRGQRAALAARCRALGVPVGGRVLRCPDARAARAHPCAAGPGHRIRSRSRGAPAAAGAPRGHRTAEGLAVIVADTTQPDVLQRTLAALGIAAAP